MDSSSTCCCCFQLRCGVTTIGVLFTISHSLGAIGSIVGVVEASQLSHWDPDRASTLGSSVATLVVTLVWVVMDAVLLYGISSRRPTSMLVWIVWTAVMLGLSFLGDLALLILSCIAGAGWVIGYSVLLFVFLIVNVYWTVVVANYRNMLSREGASSGGLVVMPGQVMPGAVYGAPMAPSQQYGMGIQYRSGMTPGGYPHQGPGMQYQPGVAAGAGYENRGMDTPYHGMDAPYRTSGTSPGGGTQTGRPTRNTSPPCCPESEARREGAGAPGRTRTEGTPPMNATDKNGPPAPTSSLRLLHSSLAEDDEHYGNEHAFL